MGMSEMYKNLKRQGYLGPANQIDQEKEDIKSGNTPVYASNILPTKVEDHDAHDAEAAASVDKHRKALRQYRGD